MTREVTEAGRFGPIEWAVAGRPMPGEDTSGDEAIAVDLGGRAALFGVIDGLGHGPAAASAAQRAAQVIAGQPALTLPALVDACHRELADTRGAAMTLACIDFERDSLQWLGVGNVTAARVSRAANGVANSAFARLTSGIVGFRLPPIPTPEPLEMRPGHLLVVASDGVAENHLDAVDFAASAKAIANRILGEHTRVIDDALVLVARHRGAT